MSRTTRRRPYGYNPGEAKHERAKHDVENNVWRYHHNRPFEKDDFYHNRDAKPFGAGKRGAFSGGPKGYSGWDDVPPSTRRYHSRAAARIIRARGKKEIRQELLAD